MRISVKAILIDGGALLINRCRGADGHEYCTFPGGGLMPFETMAEAVVRECMEESGYAVEPVRFAGLCEEISEDARERAESPDYAHRVYCFFECRLKGDLRRAPSELDAAQIGSEWVPIEKVGALPLYPEAVRKALPDWLSRRDARFFGSEL